MNKFIISSAILLSSAFAFSQNSRQWGTYYGGTRTDIGFNSAADKFGNVYLIGYTQDTSSLTFTSGGFQNTYGGGNNDAFLVKFDSNGNRLWATYYGGSGDDQGYAVTTDSNGDVYIAGFTNSPANIATAGSHDATYGGGTYDGFIAKFNASGARQWGTYYGASNSAYPQSLAVDPNGDIYVAGYTSDNLAGSIATPGAHQTVYGGGNYDAFLAKFTAAGVRLWGTYYGGSGSEGVTPPATVPGDNVGITVDAAGNPYLCGFTSSTAGIATPGAIQTAYAGATDAFLVKFTSSGTRLWGTYYGDAFQDEGRSVAVHGNNVYLSGRTASTSNIATLGSYQDTYGGGSFDSFLSRIDTSGNLIWTTYYGGTVQEWGLSVTTDLEGNIYQAGRSSSTASIASADGHQTTFGGNIDAYVVKFDTSGARYCATYLGGTGADLGYGVIVNNGRIYMAGYTASFGGIAAGGYDNTYGTGPGAGDAFMAKFTSCIYTSMSQIDPACNSMCDGSATATPSGGTLLPYTYSWSDGQTAQTATGLCAGTYTVTVYDGFGNSAVDFVTITPSSILTTTVSTLPASCGNSDGSAGVNVSGGTPAYTFAWSTLPVQTTQIATGLPAGTYSVQITDATGCTLVEVATVVNSNGPTVSIASQTDVSCNGGSDGSATATSPDVVTYSWNTIPVQTTTTATGLSAGTYTVTVTDGGSCTNTATVTITEPTPIAASVNTTNASCGGNDGTATVVASGGTPAYTYSWAILPVQTTATATGLASGTYSVTVTDANNCSATFTGTVSSTGGPTVGIASQTNASCNGGSNGSATASVSGGIPTFTYAWSTLPSQTTITATGLSAGTYTIVVTDGSACTGSATVTITEPTALSTTVTTNNATCGNNDGDASVSVSGGNPAYTYSWNTLPVQTTASATGLAAGTYTVTITDASGCTTTASATINNSNGPGVSIVAQTNVSCFGGNNGAATAGISGGTPSFTYLWSTVPSQTTISATGLSAGTYSILVTDANSCTGTTTVTITEPAVITASVSTTNSACLSNTGTATANPSGGTPAYTYSWNTLPVQTTATATGLAAGNYVVTVTDANSCTNTFTASVSNANAPVVGIASQTDVSCFGGNDGTALASVSGGVPAYTYAWSTIPSQTTISATGLSAGTYTIVVTDANSCSGLTVVTINEPTVLTTSVNTINATCGNNNGTATAVPSGGTTAYTYAWSTLPIQTTATATGLSATTYTVVVSDANGCTTSATATIATSTSPTVGIAAQTDASCNGGNDGSAMASISGGTPSFTYSWSTLPSQTTISATGLSAGTYSILVTDANGCTGTTTVTINEPTAISTTVTTTSASCGMNDGSASVVASGGTPAFTYSWSTLPVQTTATATGIPSGSYTVIITDANGCTQTDVATVGVSGGPSATISSADISCNGANDGIAIANTSGGNPPYTYVWNTIPVQTSATATGLAAGSYTVTVTDAGGCTTTANISITEPSSLSLTVSSTNATCGNNNGTVTATVSGGTPSYTYSWSPSGQTTSTATGLGGGTHIVTVTDTNGCALTDSTVISVTGGPTASVLSSTNVTCNGGNDGSATASASGANPPYTYSWNTTPVQTTAAAAGLSAGTYVVTVSDASGCTGTASVTITEPSAISLNITSTSAACGVNNGSATATVSGGNGPYSYNWSSSPVQTTASATGLLAGTYTIVITDASGCTQTGAVTIINFNGPIASISAQTNASCFGSSDGSASATATGATPPYTYSWNSSPVQNSQTATGLTAGMYTVTVTDAAGCMSIAVVAITEPAALIATVTPTSATCGTCCDGLATVSASGGTTPYTYSWSTSPAQTTPTASGLCGNTTYTVCVTDANGCSTCDSVTMPVSTGLSYASAEPGIILYPNPSDGEIGIHNLQNTIYEINIYNLFGEKVFSQTISNKPSAILNPEIEAGVYLVEIVSTAETRKIKYIKK